MKVSVVITVYNIEKYIAQCLESCLNQTYRDLEIIIVDDCGTDGSMDIVRSYTDERIKIISHEENMGAGWARRHGIEAATGDYVITVDGDDWLSEDFIGKLAKEAAKTDADIVSGGLTEVYSDGRTKANTFGEHVSVGYEKFDDYMGRKIIFLANKIVRRSMYDTIPYCTRRYCEDTPVIIPLLHLANKVAYADTAGYYYRQHDTSLCHRVNRFEQALYKGLCSIDCNRYLNGAGKEYEGLISKPEFVFEYLKVIAETVTDELAVKYEKEIDELMAGIAEYCKKN